MYYKVVGSFLNLYTRSYAIASNNPENAKKFVSKVLQLQGVGDYIEIVSVEEIDKLEYERLIWLESRKMN